MTTDQLEKPKQETSRQGTPTPDPALKRLSKLIGTWRLEGHEVGSEDYNITGTTRFKWLNHEVDDGNTGFFLQQDMEMDYAGKLILAHELIGYDPNRKAFSSFVYSNMAADPWPYEWDMQGDTWTISIKHGPMDAEFNGKLSPDGNSFSGGWRPRPGADEKINASYDVKGIRVS